MTRLLAFAAAVAAFAAAAPASAVIFPVCETRLVNAAANATAQCPTDNTPMLAGATTRRIVTVEVAAGVAKATVTCGYGVYARSDSRTVSGPQPVQFGILEQSSSSCRVELLAVYPNTTAVATSTFSYAFIGPGI